MPGKRRLLDKHKSHEKHSMYFQFSLLNTLSFKVPTIKIFRFHVGTQIWSLILKMSYVYRLGIC